ncbi:hypothetical protein M758_12G145700 [Ceratodon purpureus]|nr:hypothetical protein M758_12G145700 [Ceratodon purpureus]
MRNNTVRFLEPVRVSKIDIRKFEGILPRTGITFYHEFTYRNGIQNNLRRNFCKQHGLSLQYCAFRDRVLHSMRLFKSATRSESSVKIAIVLLS